MQVEAAQRSQWPLVEWSGRIVWMQGVDLDLETNLPFHIEVVSENAEEGDDAPSQRTPLGGHS
jgi:hypothetical protein